MVADETPAVQAVLRADTKRLRLLEEEKRLQALLEGGDDAAAERLEKVWGHLGTAGTPRKPPQSDTVVCPPPNRCTRSCGPLGRPLLRQKRGEFWLVWDLIPKCKTERPGSSPVGGE